MNAGTKGRRRRSMRLSQDRRVSDILAAANELIAANGYEGLTMAEIAERANIVEGTIYRYFKNKDELLQRVAEDWFAQNFAEIVDVRAFSGTYNKLRYLIWHSIKTTAAGPALSRYVMTELRPRANYKDSRLFELNREYTVQMRDLFSEAIRTGEFRSGVPERILRDMVFGTIEHATWRFLRGEGELDVEELADEIATVVYRGIAAEPLREDRLEMALGRLEAIADRLDGAGSLARRKVPPGRG